MIQEPAAETLGRGISLPGEDDTTLDGDGTDTTTDDTTTDDTTTDDTTTDDTTTDDTTTDDTLTDGGPTDGRGISSPGEDDYDTQGRGIS